MAGENGMEKRVSGEHGSLNDAPHRAQAKIICIDIFHLVIVRTLWDTLK